MSPDKRPRRGGGNRVTSIPPGVRTRPGRADPYAVAYFKRHVEDDPDESVPSREFLAECPASVRAQMRSVVVAVAGAPPYRFSGGGYWEAMRGDMAGYYEIRVDGAKRVHYRLFCRLDREATGRGPLLVILCGASKQFLTRFDSRVYKQVRSLGEEYLARNPRSILS